MLDIEYHIHIWQMSPQLSSSAAVTPVKYECDKKNLKGAIIRSIILHYEEINK